MTKGFQVYSQKGSHVKLVSVTRKTKTIVPLHKQLSRGTFYSILKQTKPTEDEIQELFTQ